MTWTININGHNQHADDAEHQAFEEALVEKVKTFAATLDGATVASVTGNKIGTVNALAK